MSGLLGSGGYAALLGGGATPAPGGTGYALGGALPWGGNTAGAGLFGGGALGQSYAGEYMNALGLNAANYNNILAGFQQTMGTQQAAQQGVAGGYGQLSADVLAGLRGSQQSALQGVTDQYAGAHGAAMQSLIDRGLGNSTVQASVARGLEADKAKAVTGVNNAYANTLAGYQSNLGLAGLGYQANAVNANTALARDQLNWMNSVNSPYPDAGLYAQLAAQQGQRNGGATARPWMGGSPAVNSGGSLPTPSINWQSGAAPVGYPTGGSTSGYGYAGPAGYAGGVPALGGDGGYAAVAADDYGSLGAGEYFNGGYDDLGPYGSIWGEE